MKPGGACRHAGFIIAQEAVSKSNHVPPSDIFFSFCKIFHMDASESSAKRLQTLIFNENGRANTGVTPVRVTAAAKAQEPDHHRRRPGEAAAPSIRR
ncbi:MULTISPECIES: hypothetical protein [unclassified Mesorhizobium]|uniref:hypothetical protein n=1 Tax=unclassified Mesorhizobium TaxID=325217 RepID=UPI001126D977|nr:MULTISPECIES: hypothetical protein [unclassified Mesorhizobium]MBZ9919439.1 hypothetical protein [Mesorhizobium sp. BR1-1-7]MBZ9951588.1 hypothetical protein [Mesorhizobium sp. BR1-1-15]MBZ9968662.1 hypothetical protein [Mesorhizobium sp. BR1-1-12]TPI57031.1 hypothetical protein FJW11_05270 [Mesorhizobium sp. B3-1-1]TPJ72260.1 hypothetical protein FJ462_01350 [Mesorhizobium sp. B2-6-7]